MAIFANSGQICSAGSKLLVEDSIYEEFLDRVARYSDKLTVGDGLDPTVEIGPVVSARQFEKVRGYISAGLEEGARIVTTQISDIRGDTEHGYFIRPTIFADVRDDMSICREEIFGPVLSAMRFSGAAEAVRMANASVFGLGAGVWTKDVNKVHYVSRRVRAGSVWVNCYNSLDPSVPFGGYKTSGYGRERGREHLEEHFEVKAVWTRVIEPT
jgi:aldehyde dehydrogenase (NAD+)